MGLLLFIIPLNNRYNYWLSIWIIYTHCYSYFYTIIYYINKYQLMSINYKHMIADVTYILRVIKYCVIYCGFLLNLAIWFENLVQIIIFIKDLD